MSNALTFNLAAMIAILPCLIGALKGDGAARNARFWVLLAVAVTGPFIWSVVFLSGGWRTDLSSALWVSISAGLLIYAVGAVFSHDVARLAPLFLALNFLLAVFATIGEALEHKGGGVLPPDEAHGWLWVHIPVSVATYALLAIAAVAAFAALLQERALKRKQPLRLVPGLPAVLDCEGVTVRFLWLSETVLAIGLVSGIAVNATMGHPLLTFDHKIVFALGAFVTIAILLGLHHRSGIRGRRAARWVLAAYLLVTLAYPGVKFVTDVVMG